MKADPLEYLPSAVIGAGATYCLTLGAIAVSVLLGVWGLIDLVIARRLRRG